MNTSVASGGKRHVALLLWIGMGLLLLSACQPTPLIVDVLAELNAVSDFEGVADPALAQAVLPVAATIEEATTHNIAPLDASVANEDWQIFTSENSNSLGFLPAIPEAEACADGQVWMTIRAASAYGNHSFEVWSFDGQSWQQHFEGMPALVSCAPDGPAHALVLDIPALQAATRNNEDIIPLFLYVWQDQEWQQQDAFVPHPMLVGMFASIPWLFDMNVGPSGDLWFSGMAILHLDGSEWTFYPMQYEVIMGDLAEGVTALLQEDPGSPPIEIAADVVLGSFVFDLDVGPDGSVWLTTETGISHFDGETWTPVAEMEPVGFEAGLSVSSVVDGEGALWIATPSGAARLADGNWEKFALEQPRPLVPMAADPAGAVWFLSNAEPEQSSLIFLRFDGTLWHRYPLPGKALVHLSNQLNEMTMVGTPIDDGVVGTDGALWYGGLHLLPGSPLLPPLSDEMRWSSAVPPGGPWTTFTMADGLANLQITDMATAPDGSLWITTWAGANRITAEGTWERYGREDGLAAEETGTVAVAPDGTVWFGVGAEVSRLNPDGTWTTYPPPPDMADGEWNMLTDAVVGMDGSVWFAVGDLGVSRLTADGAWTSFTAADGLADDHVRALAVGPDGAIWFATFSGLSHLSVDGTWTTYTTADGLLYDAHRAMAVAPDGSLWIASSGINRLDVDGTILTIREEEDPYVRAIDVASDGTVWFGTSEGVYQLDPEGRWTQYTTADGLAGNQVNAVAVRSDGSVWIATDGGVSRLNLEQRER